MADQCCVTAEELIAWVVNGTASPGERRQVHRHIAVCGQCRCQYVVSIALKRRLDAAAAALPRARLTFAALAAVERPSRIRRAERAVGLMEAAGTPAFATRVLRGILALADPRPSLRVNIPMVALVDTPLRA
jgi:anti-sigma factor RsiW